MSPIERAYRVVPLGEYHYRGHVGRAEEDARLRKAIAREIRQAVAAVTIERDAALARVAEMDGEHG